MPTLRDRPRKVKKEKKCGWKEKKCSGSDNKRVWDSYFHRIKMVPFDHISKHDEHSEGEYTSDHLPQIHSHRAYFCWIL